jgi:molybdopterin-guanine dinucleotide biosynthesis protein A
MGGAKPARLVAGRPLASYPAGALLELCERVAVVAKPGLRLPDGPWELWDDEPLEPRHPAAGIAHALRRAGARLLVCAADMPFVTVGDCELVLAAAPGAGTAVAVADGELQPTLGVYDPAVAGALADAAERGEPLRRAVAELDPVWVELPAAAVRSVNTPAELAAAERELASRAP